MGWKLLAVALLAVAAPDRPVSVSPAHGDPQSVVLVSWRAGRQTEGRRLVVSAIATRASRGPVDRGCTSSVSLNVLNFTPGSRVARHLRPEGRWCRDLYRGRVIIAPRPRACESAPKCTADSVLIGRFRFRIR